MEYLVKDHQVLSYRKMFFICGDRPPLFKGFFQVTDLVNMLLKNYSGLSAETAFEFIISTDRVSNL